MIFMFMWTIAIPLKNSDPYFFKMVVNITRFLLEFLGISALMAVLAGILASIWPIMLLSSHVIPFIAYALAYANWWRYDSIDTAYFKITGDYYKFNKSYNYGDKSL